MSRPLAAFAALSLFWGTSFLFIKIALRTLDPFTLVGFRLLIGLLGLLVLLWIRGERLRTDRTLFKHFIFMGAFNTAIPFALYTWAESGENGIDSSVASVLNSTVPLFTIVLAVYIVRSETANRGKVLGLILGFVGVLLLFGRSLITATLSGELGALLPLGAGLLAAVFYAISANYAKHFLSSKVSPLVLSTYSLCFANLFVWAFAFLFETQSEQRLTSTTLFALVWLGLLGTCLAYIFYFFILQEWGATRAALVTYVLPVIGVSAGAIFLSEAVTWELVIGGLLILSGIWAVNRFGAT